MEPLILKGDVAKAAAILDYGDGSGSGSDYGYGDGSGYGYGYGYGDGSGDGDGDGDGNGYGSGYGYGYGDGSGSGDGDGDYGSGYGDGDGDGYGYGYGYGYADGSGYGSGGSGSDSGYGDGSYWASSIAYFAAKWNEAQQQRMVELKKAGAKFAFWRSTSKGLPSNGGGKIEAAAPGVIHTAPGPLNLCNAGTLHATLIPPTWKGERWWIVALKGEVIGDDEKYGALEREIIGEAL